MKDLIDIFDSKLKTNDIIIFEQKTSKIITMLQLIDKAGIQLLQGMIKHL
jgi:hypothetical protein